MPNVRFTSALNRFFPTLQEEQVAARTVSEALDEIEQAYPGLKDYLLDEQGRLRRHVNIFVQGELIADRVGLSDRLKEGDEVHIFQALSGG